MKVLIACEESQTVAKAFRTRGHEAYSADIQLCGGGLSTMAHSRRRDPVYQRRLHIPDGKRRRSHDSGTMGFTDRTSAMYIYDACGRLPNVSGGGKTAGRGKAEESTCGAGLFLLIHKRGLRTYRDRKSAPAVNRGASGRKPTDTAVSIRRSVFKINVSLVKKPSAAQTHKNNQQIQALCFLWHKPE